MAYWKRINDIEFAKLVREGVDTEAAVSPTCDDCAEKHVPFRTLAMRPGHIGPPDRQQERPWCWSPTWGGNCIHCGSRC
jgi:hypothetical protein